MKNNPTTPTPAAFDDFEPALVTRAEFLAYRNPKEQFHDPEVYPSTVDELYHRLLELADSKWA